MENTIKNDFADFINNTDIFNSSVLLYTSANVLKFDGKCIFDEKPMAVQNENGMVSYSGEMSLLTLSMANLATYDVTFMPAYFNLKNYKVTITDNLGTKSFTIEDSHYNSNVGSIFCYLKLV